MQRNCVSDIEKPLMLLIVHNYFGILCHFDKFQQQARKMRVVAIECDNLQSQNL